MSARKKVAVLMGGPSSEREVSFMSGRAVMAALQSRGFDCIAFDPAERSVLELPSLGVTHAFIALHGRFGEDGTLQGALEVMGIPYTGSGVMASALALDKHRTKLIWKSSGIPIANFEMMSFEQFDPETAPQVLKKLGGTVMVKPVTAGSSIGMTKVSDATSLQAALALANEYDHNVMLEQFIEGRELTVTVLGRFVLPIIEIVAPEGKYDYQNKYFTDDVKYLCPAEIPAAQYAAIQADALRAFDALGCKGWGRADVMLAASGDYYFLEINTSPGMTGHSLTPIAAKAVDMSFPELCEEILHMASLESEARHVG
jgi:D-alanine-D-alanine ligase